MATDNDKKRPGVLRFHVLTPNGKKQDIEFFEAEEDALFIVRRSRWSDELVFTCADADDSERLLGAMPAEEALKREFKRGWDGHRGRCLPEGHPMHEGVHGDMVPDDTLFTQLLQDVEGLFLMRHGCFSAQLTFWEKLRRLAEEGLDWVHRKECKAAAEHAAESRFYCWGNCVVRMLPDAKRARICKRCRRNEGLVDNFDDGKEGSDESR